MPHCKVWKLCAGDFENLIVMHISTACPGGTPPGQLGGNEGEFGILSVYSAREPRGNYKLCNNRTTGGGEIGDFDVTI